MALAIILILLLVGSVLFNFLSPWQATPVASNWGSIDTTIVITLVITGVFFIGITLFVAYALIRYRHRGQRAEGEHQASYEPDNKQLEWWLTIITTVGICALLAPGLVVYGDFVSVPEEAAEVEVMGKQWTWNFRLPGTDGVLGRSAISLVSLDNPFGLDPNDPNGQDDVLVTGSELHLAKDQPVKMLLRSLDVLHNFYVPQFRAKMDMVPGQVSYFWFTPTQPGSYEVLCAEYCGVAHYNMKGRVVVDNAADYADWLAAQPTFASQLRGAGSDGAVAQGRQLAEGSGCLACHSIDGSRSLGPGWQQAWGRETTLSDGSTVTFDAAYFKESVRQPKAKLVEGYAPVMTSYAFTDSQLDALIAFIRSLSADVSESSSGNADNPASLAQRGAKLASNLGCVACHSADGSRLVGPTWQGLFGRQRTLADGSEITADEDYIRESITDPKARVVEGFAPVMQAYSLDRSQLDALVEYTKTL